MTFEIPPEEQPGNYINELEDNCRRLAKDNEGLRIDYTDRLAAAVKKARTD